MKYTPSFFNQKYLKVIFDDFDLNIDKKLWAKSIFKIIFIKFSRFSANIEGLADSTPTKYTLYLFFAVEKGSDIQPKKG